MYRISVENISTKVFDSQAWISLSVIILQEQDFFASACKPFRSEVQDLDEGKSQIAHGETVRETANMILFMADVIGIRDDMYIGKGNAYMHMKLQTCWGRIQGRQASEQRPTLVNLSDIDHPITVYGWCLHVIHEFGGLENLI